MDSARQENVAGQDSHKQEAGTGYEARPRHHRNRTKGLAEARNGQEVPGIESRGEHGDEIAFQVAELEALTDQHGGAANAKGKADEEEACDALVKQPVGDQSHNNGSEIAKEG